MLMFLSQTKPANTSPSTKGNMWDTELHIEDMQEITEDSGS